LTRDASRPRIVGVQEERGEVLIAPGSQRPATVADVTRRIIVPAILERIFTDASGESVS
jgi:hypothetical protein